jgi:hypothetical protein
VQICNDKITHVVVSDVRKERRSIVEECIALRSSDVAFRDKDPPVTTAIRMQLEYEVEDVDGLWRYLTQDNSSTMPRSPESRNCYFACLFRFGNCATAYLAR